MYKKYIEEFFHLNEVCTDLRRGKIERWEEKSDDECENRIQFAPLKWAFIYRWWFVGSHKSNRSNFMESISSSIACLAAQKAKYTVHKKTLTIYFFCDTYNKQPCKDIIHRSKKAIKISVENSLSSHPFRANKHEIEVNSAKVQIHHTICIKNE